MFKFGSNILYKSDQENHFDFSNTINNMLHHFDTQFFSKPLHISNATLRRLVVDFSTSKYNGYRLKIVSNDVVS